MIGAWMLSLVATAAELVPEAQLRPRWEADTGRDSAPSAGGVSYATMRSRLGGTLSAGPVAARVVFADVRVFGEEAHTRQDFSADGMDMPIGTLTWSPGSVAVTVGRMQTSLLNERLLAIANWRQPGRSFDGVRLTLDRPALTLDARALLIAEGDTHDFAATDQVTPGEDDQQLFLLAATRGALSAVAVHQRGTGAQSTAGLLYDGAPTSALSVTAEAYAQLRTEDAGAELAAMAAVEGLCALPVAWAPQVGMQLEWLSGEGAGLSTFDTIYGANHRYYGHIDMINFVEGGNADGQGLVAPAALLRLAPREDLSVSLDLHAFFAAQPLDDPFLAVEPDLAARAVLAEGLSAVWGVNAWLPADPAAREVMGWAMLDLRL